MGKHKTDRTDQLRQAAKRYIIAEQAQNHIEQHNFDRLVAQGVIIEGKASEKVVTPQVAGRAIVIM